MQIFRGVVGERSESDCMGTLRSCSYILGHICMKETAMTNKSFAIWRAVLVAGTVIGLAGDCR